MISPSLRALKTRYFSIKYIQLRTIGSQCSVLLMISKSEVEKNKQISAQIESNTKFSNLPVSNKPEANMFERALTLGDKLIRKLENVKPKDWKRIHFKEDLLSQAKNQIELLADIDKEKIFYEGEILERAVYRYEKYWLPFCADIEESGHDTNKLYPPLDIAWVWHCHMLNPLDYIKDCKAVCGRVIDHSNQNRDANQEKRTKDLWEKKLDIPYDYHTYKVNKDDINGFQSRINYDLKAASSRQKNFYYQVSLPHFMSEKYLEKCLERYKKFLFLKLMNPNEFIVPCYGIDIIWHTHQLLPRLYAKETRKLYGDVFSHDDTTNDRSPGSKLNVSSEKTRKLWKDLYGQNFFFNGAMYRGDRPERPYFNYNDNVYNKLCINTNSDMDKSIEFELLQQPFEPVHMNANLHEYGSFDLKNRDFNAKDGVGIRAKNVITRKVNNEKISLYNAEILHIVSMQWSSVKIYFDEHVYATSHLIGLRQLPSPNQIEEHSLVITYDPKTERAMLVRNLNGDYAIVKGKWVGLKSGIFRDDPQHLEITVYFLGEKRSNKNIRVNLDSLFQFETNSTKMSVDLKNGKITALYLQDTVNRLEIESNLALALSVAILQAVLQPNPPKYLKSVKNDKPNNELTSSNSFIGGGCGAGNYHMDNSFDSADSSDGGSCGGCGGCGSG